HDALAARDRARRERHAGASMEERPVETRGLAVGVRFRPSGRVYVFDPGPLVLVRDDRVLVETERGPALGTVVALARPRPTARALQRVIKKADSRDLAREDQNLQRERQHYGTALELVRGRNLAVKLVKAESAFDASKVTFFFSGAERVDLRDLGRELAELLLTRVEMKQIGARDETKVTGGIGPCGRELFCSSWLQEVQPVSVKMAKEQGLSLNASHLGHFYVTLVGDVLGRFWRARGRTVFTLTGTDEHGDKIAQAAAAAGVTPQALADRVSALFRSTWEEAGLRYDHFIRTTDAYHVRYVQRILARVHARGDVYFGSYRGLYCFGCERFYQEREL